MTMPDPIRRALRTFVQAFLGSLLTSGVLSAAATDGVVDWSALKKAGIAAAAAAVIALFTLAQNLLEDTTRFPAVLKAVASSGENPVPAPGRARDENGRFVAQRGQVDPVTLLVVVILIVVLVLLLGDRI